MKGRNHLVLNVINQQIYSGRINEPLTYSRYVAPGAALPLSMEYLR